LGTLAALEARVEGLIELGGEVGAVMAAAGFFALEGGLGD